MAKKEEYQKKKHNQSLEEQAINQSTKDGEDINHQVEERREQHLPRDTAWYYLAYALLYKELFTIKN